MTNNETIPPMTSRQNGGNLTRFLNDIKDFSGITSGFDGTGGSSLNNPLTWFKKLDRLKDLARLTDKEILLIAADHLTGKAEAWFDVACKDIKTWDAFQVAFKKKYWVGMEDIWWGQIRHMKQGPSESVDDVDVRLRELFTLVQVSDERLMIRSFLDAIEPGIAWEVERNFAANQAPNLEDVVANATRYEMVLNKYRSKGASVFGQIADNEVSSSLYKKTLRPDPPITTPSDASVSTIGDLLKEFRELKISLVQSVGQGAANGRNVRGLTCFYCNREGHKKTDCPDWLASRKQETYATGVNAIPLGAGKDSGLRQ